MTRAGIHHPSPVEWNCISAPHKSLCTASYQIQDCGLTKEFRLKKSASLDSFLAAPQQVQCQTAQTAGQKSRDHKAWCESNAHLFLSSFPSLIGIYDSINAAWERWAGCGLQQTAKKLGLKSFFLTSYDLLLATLRRKSQTSTELWLQTKYAILSLHGIDNSNEPQLYTWSTLNKSQNISCRNSYHSCLALVPVFVCFNGILLSICKIVPRRTNNQPESPSCVSSSINVKGIQHERQQLSWSWSKVRLRLIATALLLYRNVFAKDSPIRQAIVLDLCDTER